MPCRAVCCGVVWEGATFSPPPSPSVVQFSHRDSRLEALVKLNVTVGFRGGKKMKLGKSLPNFRIRRVHSSELVAIYNDPEGSWSSVNGVAFSYYCFCHYQLIIMLSKLLLFTSFIFAELNARNTAGRGCLTGFCFSRETKYCIDRR